MKALFAALLLFFQLQPVLGTVACLGLAQPTPQAECQMPEHGAVPHSTVAQTPAMSSCVLASVCAPSPLAIAALADGLQSSIPLYTKSPRVTPPILLGNSSAPPFDPPRA